MTPSESPISTLIIYNKSLKCEGKKVEMQSTVIKIGL